MRREWDTFEMKGAMDETSKHSHPSNPGDGIRSSDWSPGNPATTSATLQRPHRAHSESYCLSTPRGDSTEYRLHPGGQRRMGSFWRLRRNDTDTAYRQDGHRGDPFQQLQRRVPMHPFT